ncbi:uncharacterized protein A4U43_C05F29610 [Asparagus officinalis]|uniref:SP-RING-type domain-containing protein n=1 Tax=Asparagus officinalis TaxID=4686 RepID=A0A5P1EVD7_ASPOF|nr:uncharacterized protein A4U43_C05F29610 [Asparagus officinalis]
MGGYTMVAAGFTTEDGVDEEIRKSINIFKTIAVDLEKNEKTDKVKQLEEGVLELLETYDDCARFSDAIKSMGESYQPSDEPTDFRKVLEDEVAKLKAASPSVPASNPLYRNFKEAVWSVHHAGQPMPGEEQEDIIMTSTQNNILNIMCPITGKPVIELQDPVRCMDCKHIYEKGAIMQYIRKKKPQPTCPIGGCPRILQAARIVCDPELLVEIEEMRATYNTEVHATAVEDFTVIDDE